MLQVTPWASLTRHGMPKFVVSRLALTLSGNTFDPGSEVSAETFVHKARLRQLYEQRRVVPVEATRTDRNARARQARLMKNAGVVATVPALNPVGEVVVLTPVGEAIQVAEELVATAHGYKSRAGKKK